MYLADFARPDASLGNSMVDAECQTVKKKSATSAHTQSGVGAAMSPLGLRSAFVTQYLATPLNSAVTPLRIGILNAMSV